MQRRRKQLLGLAGLVGVAIMTAVACVISAPDVGAVGKSGDVNVKVTIQNAGKKSEVRFVSLNDGDTEVRQKFKVKVAYTHATTLKLFLKNDGALASRARIGANPDADETEVDLTGSSCENITYSDEEQFCEAEYDLGPELPGVNGTQFTTRAYVDNGNTSQSDDDGLVFFYRTAFLQFEGEYDKDGNPIAYAKLNDKVKEGLVQVFDVNNKPVFTNPIDVLKSGELQADGRYKLTLPLKGANVETGKYTAILTALGDDPDGAGELTTIGISQVTGINYTKGGSTKPPVNPDEPDEPGGPDEPDKPTNPDNPETPDTGLNLFRDLNISRADYILTGLVAFGIVTGFAIFLIVRRNKR